MENQGEHRCWKCGTVGGPPSLDEQLGMLKVAHRMMDTPWWWSDAEFARLREMLREGDVLAVARNIVQLCEIRYAGAQVVRADGTSEFIDRRKLR